MFNVPDGKQVEIRRYNEDKINYLNKINNSISIFLKLFFWSCVFLSVYAVQDSTVI